MAVSRAALEIILQAKDEASRILGGVGNALGGLGTVAGAAATGGIALAAAGVAAVGTAAVVAGKEIFEFSQESAEAMRLLEARTGATENELRMFREQALDVFESGFGESVGDISDAMATVNQVLDEQGDALEASTRRALVLRDTFGVDVTEGVSIAAAAVKSGLADNSEEAFDIITTGLQEGLSQAGDFGDTIREYSSDFARLGFEADETLGLLNAGLEAGAYNTDVIADGVREFGIRFGAAEESAIAALDSIGINSEELYAQYEAGEITVAEAMATVSGALGEVDSQTLQAQAGAALFGSKWEDVGGQVFIAAGQAQDAIDDVSGATDAAGEAMNQGFGPAVERLQRTFVTNLSPLGDVVVETLDKAQPFIERATVWLGEKVPEGIDWLDRKWNEFFPPARDKALALWEDIQPGIEWVEARFNTFSQNVLPGLKEGWLALNQGIEIVKTVVNEDLMPALRRLLETLGINTDNTDDMAAAFGEFVGFLVSTGVKALILGIVMAVENLSEAFDTARWMVLGWREGLDGIRDAVDWVVDKIEDLKWHLGNLSLPDWLTPGSPTPFELGLRGIARAAADLPDLGGTFNVQAMGGGGMPLAGAAAGGGGGVTIINNFGRGSVRNDDDIEQIARDQEEILAVRGVRSWGV